jgi:hypothetical protein
MVAGVTGDVEHPRLYVLAVRHRDRDRWPDEPRETFEPAERDRDGRFPDGA